MVTPDVVRDVFVSAVLDIVRTPDDVVRFNQRIQRAIVEAEQAETAWLTDLAELKLRINTGFPERRRNA